jgi:hypothetical protein
VTRWGRATLVAVTVLGASCTGDRPVGGASDQGPTEPDGGKPTCQARPGRGVEGFMLVRTREIDEGEHVALREEYRDREGRRLYYLLGLFGEIGEGLAVRRQLELVNGERAVFLGRGENWILLYEDEFPCPQVAVIGNGFRRGEFLDLLVEASIVQAG